LAPTVINQHALRWLRTSSLVLAATGLCACVTINIYFPAAAAEKAADKVIDEIWQTPAGQSPAASPSSVPTAAPVTPSATPVTPSVNQEVTP
jgi:hypothetical protein